jgi:hypothetical protein
MEVEREKCLLPSSHFSNILASAQPALGKLPETLIKRWMSQNWDSSATKMRDWPSSKLEYPGLWDSFSRKFQTLTIHKRKDPYEKESDG